MATWQDQNQAALVSELDRVRELVQRHAERATDATVVPEPAPPEPVEPGITSQRASALEVLCSTFELSGFERDILLLCAGVELDARFQALCASILSAQRHQPTLGLALAALPGAHWSALAPTSPLRYWRLIELGRDGLLTSSPLRIDEAVLHFLAGLPLWDERLAPYLQAVDSTADLSPSQASVAERVTSLWTAPGSSGAAVVELVGPDAIACRTVAAAVCQQAGMPLYRIVSNTLPQASVETEALMRLWERQAAINSTALLIEQDDADVPAGERSTPRPLATLVEHIRTPLLLSGNQRHTTRRRMLSFDVPTMDRTEQRELWRAALGPTADLVNGQLERVVSQFELPADGIRAAAATLAGRNVGGTPADAGRALWEACREQARTRLDDLALRLESTVGWDDLVAGDQQMQTLHDIVDHVRHRMIVYEDWGFAARNPRGLGVTALFAGPSGTGKTLAAQVLANELRLDLHIAEVSSILSKWVGETERNLRRLFDAAESGGSVLLFDEADALFGKRSEQVRDAHDRYVNIEVSYLLQRMESYRGLAILTTNMKDALDPAFMRRIRFAVDFPFPSEAERAEIWRRAFPATLPTQQLDFEALGRLSTSGGSIRNIALSAAFLAATDGAPLQMRHIYDATRREFAKLGKPVMSHDWNQA